MVFRRKDDVTETSLLRLLRPFRRVETHRVERLDKVHVLAFEFV